MDEKTRVRIADRLQFLYGDTALLDDLQAAIAAFPVQPRTAALTERDALVIAYGDHLQQAGEAPLATLRRFALRHLRGLVSGLHILPFYPYTSDDGFSVVDFRQVNPALGNWDNVRALGTDFRLMFDLVLNHVSVSSPWFQGFLNGDEPYRDYFVTASPDDDLTAVVRPRTHPVLTPFQTAEGVQHVWTTFSTDQVDLNYANPRLLLEIVKTLLFYVQQGADFIRLDAIAYLWKSPGTGCIHLPQTHAVVQLLRAVLDAAAPWVKLITETNVPHEENLSYFGDGQNEAQLVYQFALPPLLLHTLHTGDARVLSEWAATLQTPSDQTTFFNFTASHDGIGVRPVTGLISDQAVEAMLKTVEARGGQISYKANSDGSRSAYEMNITYFDALAVPGEPLQRSVDRFMVSQAIMLALAGVPGIYLTSLFGAGNWQEGVAQTGRARTINRQKFDLAALETSLNDANSRYGQVWRRYATLLRLRQTQPAFHPNSPQRVLDIHPGIFALERGNLLTVFNVSDTPVQVDLPAGQWHDLIGNKPVRHTIPLSPYQFAWLTPEVAS
ncbi:MAG: sugar phosphorylase [Chloroflexi bacterium]|nr:sugar phosphorylase [Chloroflexota bacterium]